MSEQWPSWIGVGFVLVGHLVAFVILWTKQSGKIDALSKAADATTRAIEMGTAATTRAIEAAAVAGATALQEISKQETRLAVHDQRILTMESDIREVRATYLNREFSKP